MQTTNQISIVEMTEFLSDMLGIDKTTLLKNSNLISEFGLNILDIVELIIELEDKFDISISRDDILQTEKSLKFKPTPKGMTNFINKCLTEN